MPKVKSIQIGWSGAGPIIAGNIAFEDKEKNAAWELYVELVTRVSVVKLQPDEGLLREALSSIYTLFGSTREILRQYGPEVAKIKPGGNMSFGALAVRVLNEILRPVLAKWHPLLEDYESTKPEDKSRLEHENEWERNAELRQVIEETRATLDTYAQSLADIAEIPHLAGSQDSGS